MRSLEGDERDGGTLDSTDGGEDVGAGVEHGKKAAVEEAERPFEKPAAPTQQDGGLGLWSLLPLNPTRPSVGFDELSHLDTAAAATDKEEFSYRRLDNRKEPKRRQHEPKGISSFDASR